MCVHFQYACAQYVVGYLTKNECGISKLLKAVNDQAKGLSNLDLIKEISTVLDKHREVSIQEAIYRLLSLPMTKSSIRVKYVSTVHPHFRDGLLRGNIGDLPDDDDSIFHNSLLGIQLKLTGWRKLIKPHWMEDDNYTSTNRGIQLYITG